MGTQITQKQDATAVADLETVGQLLNEIVLRARAVNSAAYGGPTDIARETF
jgi:hypothetical protein